MAGLAVIISIVDAGIAVGIARRASCRKIQAQSGRRHPPRHRSLYARILLSFRVPFFWREEPAFPDLAPQRRHQHQFAAPLALVPRPTVYNLQFGIPPPSSP
jgi:hypothetical protein